APARGGKGASSGVAAAYQLGGYSPGRSLAVRRSIGGLSRMRSRCRPAWRVAALHVQQQVVALPGRDHLEEGLDLVALDRLVGAAEVRAEDAGDLGTFLEQVEGREEVARDRPRPVVGLPCERLARLDPVLETEIAAGERGGDREIGIAVHADDAVLDPARLGRRDRDADAGGAVVRPPFEIDRGRAARDV